MKRIILISGLLLTLCLTAAAQPRAAGIRLGYGLDLSYQHTVDRINFVEADLGFYGFNRFNMSLTYNLPVYQPHWTEEGEWGIYAGAGIGMGSGGDYFRLGFVCNVGVEYTFWFPLQLTFDLRPHFGIGYEGNGFDLWGWIPQIGARYRF